MSEKYGAFLVASHSMVKRAQRIGGMSPVETLLFYETLIQEIEDHFQQMVDVDSEGGVSE